MEDLWNHVLGLPEGEVEAAPETSPGIFFSPTRRLLLSRCDCEAGPGPLMKEPGPPGAAGGLLVAASSSV